MCQESCQKSARGRPRRHSRTSKACRRRASPLERSGEDNPVGAKRSRDGQGRELVRCRGERLECYERHAGLRCVVDSDPFPATGEILLERRKDFFLGVIAVAAVDRRSRCHNPRTNGLVRIEQVPIAIVLFDHRGVENDPPIIADGHALDMAGIDGGRRGSLRILRLIPIQIRRGRDVLYPRPLLRQIIVKLRHLVVRQR